MHRAILCLAAVAVALAAPTTPPVITLDLAAASGLSKLANSALLVHDLGITQPDGTPVGSRQDYVQRCQVDATTCPLPKANAFDHQDGKLAVTVRVFKVDQVTCGTIVVGLSSLDLILVSPSMCLCPALNRAR